MSAQTNIDFRTIYALLTLEEFANQASNGPVRPTWGLKLALYVLHTQASVEKAECRQFWRALAYNPTPTEMNEATVNIIRGGECSTSLERMYRQAGVRRSPGMTFAGATGEKPTRARPDCALRPLI